MIFANMIRETNTSLIPFPPPFKKMRPKPVKKMAQFLKFVWIKAKRLSKKKIKDNDKRLICELFCIWHMQGKSHLVKSSSLSTFLSTQEKQHKAA